VGRVSEEERKLANEERHSAQTINRQRHGDITTLALDMEEAHRLAEQPQFYLPMYMDFRGRVYALALQLRPGRPCAGACSCSRTGLRLPKRVHIGYKYT
jgi:DNA-directed RNA polymerase